MRMQNPATNPQSTTRTWWTLAEARDHLDACKDPVAARNELVHGVALGAIAAKTMGILYPRDGMASMPVPPGPVTRRLWRRIAALPQADIWSASRFDLEADEKQKATTVLGIRVDAAGVRALGEEHGRTAPVPAAIVDEPGAGKPRSKGGGADSGKHGEPIARLTLALAKDRNSVDGLTAVKLKPKVLAAYRDADKTPPSDDNAKRIAAGILRAFKAADQ